MQVSLVWVFDVDLTRGAFAATILQESQKPLSAQREAGDGRKLEYRGGSNAGGDIAVEFTPIEDWLEIEIGTTPVFAPHTAEWDTDTLLKKPWTLSKTAELMIGVAS